MINTRVLIVGAGASGVAAAQRLAKLGLDDFIVLEAGDRVGGRVHSKKLGENCPMIEFGAQWIHGEEGNIAYQLAKKFGLRSCNKFSISDPVYLWDDGTKEDCAQLDQLQISMARIEERLLAGEGLRDVWSSQGEFYMSSIREETEMSGLVSAYIQWYGRLQAAIDGSSGWLDTGVDMNFIYRECPGDQHVTIEGGLSILLERLGDGVMDRVRLAERVTKVKYDDNVVMVETEDNIYSARHVIMTLGLGVLKHEVNSMFDPLLPADKIEAINSLGFGTIAKLFIEFPAEFSQKLLDLYPSGVNFLRRAESDLTSPLWLNKSSSSWEDGIFGLYPVGDNIFVSWLSGPAAQRVELLSTNRTLPDHVHMLFSKFLGPDTPRPVRLWVTDWGTNPLTRGSYSYITPHTQPGASAILAKPVGDCSLLFAGEASHSSYIGTVHGAVETGWREADRVMSWINSQS